MWVSLETGEDTVMVAVSTVRVVSGASLDSGLAGSACFYGWCLACRIS